MKFNGLAFIFVLVLCFILLSCAPPVKEEIDIAQLHKTIEDKNLKFQDAVRQGDAAALAALYTDEATILPPNSDMIQGKQAIETFWSSSLQIGVKDIVLTAVDISGSGDLAYEIGKYTLIIQPEGQEPTEEKGKYVVVLKKTADSSWKLHVDIWNSSMAAQ